jgi:hypothetical protein
VGIQAEQLEGLEQFFLLGRTRARAHTADKGELFQPFQAGDSAVLADLLIAAMRACDFNADSEQAREQMRADCLNTPAHLHADLLAHFQSAYGDTNE